MATASPRVLKVDRVGPIIEGLVESDSREGKRHYGRILVSSSLLCGCEASFLGGRSCKHLKAVLETLDKDDLIQAILDGAGDPDGR